MSKSASTIQLTLLCFIGPYRMYWKASYVSQSKTWHTCIMFAVITLFANAALVRHTLPTRAKKSPTHETSREKIVNLYSEIAINEPVFQSESVGRTRAQSWPFKSEILKIEDENFNMFFSPRRNEKMADWHTQHLKS